MNKTFFIIAVAIIVAVGGIFVLRQGKGYAPQQSSEGVPQNQQTVEPNTIVYSDSGYAPKEITVKRGETVTFKNESAGVMWPATAFHPTHTVYPNSSVLKCGTPEEGNMFDACRDIEAGMEWSFQFDQTGSWKYHDHRVPTRNGTIIVE